MLRSPHEVATMLNRLAPNVGMEYKEMGKMIDSWLFVLGMFVIDMTAFGEWMEATYPEYQDKSLKEFLTDKDPCHIEEWKELLGVGEDH